MKLHITKIIFLHSLGTIYEICTRQSFTQRVLIPKLLGKPRRPSEAEAAYLNERAASAI